MSNFCILFIHSANMGNVFNRYQGTLRILTKILFSVCPQELRVQPKEMSHYRSMFRFCNDSQPGRLSL